MASPILTKVESVTANKLRLTWDTPILPQGRNNLSFYSITEKSGESVGARVVSVDDPDRFDNLFSYTINTTRLTHNGRYVLNVLAGTIGGEGGQPIVEQNVSFTAMGVVPTFSVIPENANSIIVYFNQDMIITSGIRDMRNYSFEGGISVTGIEVLDKRRVRLFTTTQTIDAFYKLRIGRSVSR